MTHWVCSWKLIGLSCLFDTIPWLHVFERVWLFQICNHCLLLAFVWDPLVEWMQGDGHDEAVIGGEEHKGMELAVSLSLFASRLQEIRVPLQVFI